MDVSAEWRPTQRRWGTISYGLVASASDAPFIGDRHGIAPIEDDGEGRPPFPGARIRGLSVSAGSPSTVSGHRLRPTCLAPTPDLRVALEGQVAAQAEQMASAFGPPIDGVRRGPACQMHHLSVVEDAICAK